MENASPYRKDQFMSKNLQLEAAWIKNGIRKPDPEDPSVSMWALKYNPHRADKYLLGDLLYHGREAFERRCHNNGEDPARVLLRNDLDNNGFPLYDEDMKRV